VNLLDASSATCKKSGQVGLRPPDSNEGPAAADMIRAMPRAAMCLALAGVLLAGCGSLSPAQQYAESINLKAADVPGFRAVEDEVEGDNPGVEGDAYARCAYSPPATLLVVSRRSPSFQSDVISLASHVEIWPTSKLASRSVAAYDSKRGSICEAHELESKPQLGARVSKVVDELLPSQALNVPGSYWRRVIVVTTRPGTRISRAAYLDNLGFLLGRAEIRLSVSAYRPPPAALEQRLLSLLYSRAKAHSL
jgi:hypothetical protein